MSNAMGDPAEIRRAKLGDSAAMARVHVASWRSTYPGIVPQSHLDALDVDEFAARWQQRISTPSEMVIDVAISSGAICGFAAGGPARTNVPGCSGELYALYLLAQFQRKGIGARLLQSLAEQLHQAGHSGMYVWVLQENAARSFYERMGGSLLATTEINLGGKTLTEVSYSWRDLNRLRARAPQGERGTESSMVNTNA